MLKWFLRILYAFVVIIIGIVVLNEAFANKRLTYLEENAQPHFVENDMDSFMEEYYVAASRNQYIDKPLYRANSNDPNYKFSFSIYHSQAFLKDGNANVLAFVLHNLDMNIQPLDVEEFDKNNNLIRIRVSMQFENGLVQQDYNLDGHIMPLPTPYSMDVSIPMEIQVVENEEGGKVFGINEGVTGKIEEIKFEIIDSTLYEDEPKRVIFAVLQTNANTTDKHLVEENIVTGQVTTLNHEGDEVVIDTLRADLFNGDVLRYDLADYYENTPLGVTILESELDKLDEYNGIIVKFLSIFILIALAVTYLLFFLNPTIKYFRNKRAENVMKDAKTNKSLFRDQ